MTDKLLLSIHESMTPAPWVGLDTEPPIIRARVFGGAAIVPVPFDGDDAVGIAVLRNALPALAAVLSEAEAVCNDERTEWWPEYGSLRAALAALAPLLIIKGRDHG